MERKERMKGTPPLFVELSEKDRERIESIKEYYEAKTLAEAVRIMIREKHDQIEKGKGVSN